MKSKLKMTLLWTLLVIIELVANILEADGIPKERNSGII